MSEIRPSEISCQWLRCTRIGPGDGRPGSALLSFTQYRHKYQDPLLSDVLYELPSNIASVSPWLDSVDPECCEGEDWKPRNRPPSLPSAFQEAFTNGLKRIGRMQKTNRARPCGSSSVSEGSVMFVMKLVKTSGLWIS